MIRFTIRDVLWLTVVVAVAVSWWLHVKAIEDRYRRRDEELYRRAAAIRDEAKAEMERIQKRFNGLPLGGVTLPESTSTENRP